MKKNILLAVIIAVFANICTAQEFKDKVYFDEDWNITDDASKASYYRLYNANDKSSGLKPYQDYYINGILQGDGYYSRIVYVDGEINFIEEGEQKNYYDNGKLREKWYKKNGEMHGEDIMYYENGNPKYQAYYDNGIPNGKYTMYDSTGRIDRILNYKNGFLDGKQVQYSPANRSEIWKVEYFKNGLMEKEIGYIDGKVRKEFTLISLNEDSFVANETWFLREDEDSSIGKRSVDFLYDFDPNIWKYAFQMFYVETANFNGEISKKHGKCQSFDRNGRIVEDGNYSFDNKIGKWTTYLYSQKCYYVEDYDEDTPTKYFTLDHKPFSGPLTITRPDGAEIFFNIKNGIRVGKYTVNHYDKNGKLYVKYFGNFDENGELDGYTHSEIEVDGKWQTADFNNYKHGEKHGEWREIKGDSIIYCTYNNDLLEGRYEIRKVHSYNDFVKEKDNLRDLIVVGYFKDDMPHGTFEWYDDEGRITTKGNYTNGNKSGIWTYYFFNEKLYYIANFDNNEPHKFYTLDGKPFSGKHTAYYEKEEDDDPDTVEMTIKNSLIQQVDFIDSVTGKVLQTNRYKNGLPINK
ncbi:MAG: hypothetical protein IKQ46_05270 [Bacteroidales bacterium]|nr:hypothetical protein [Bacteroidales bacterium]